jgi:hypothetical protein
MNYFYNLKIDVEISLQSFIESISQNLLDVESSHEFSFSLKYLEYSTIILSALTQTNFEIVDKEFCNFGKIYLKLIRKISRNSDLILDSFSKLVLSNFEFSNSELFPEKNIQGIGSKLQVELLLNGMYFKLLPDVLRDSLDIKFSFE